MPESMNANIRTPRRPIKPPRIDKSKTRTTLCLPESMLDAIHRAMDREGVTRKRRSQWIEGTVIRLFELPGADQLILEEFIEPNRNKTIPVTLGKEVKEQIDRMIRVLSRETERTVESSALLRTAISQSLLRHRR